MSDNDTNREEAKGFKRKSARVTRADNRRQCRSVEQSTQTVQTDYSIPIKLISLFPFRGWQSGALTNFWAPTATTSRIVLHGSAGKNSFKEAQPMKEN